MIDLTPLEVRKKKTDFRRVMRGYDPALVDDFLDLVADRLDELVRENSGLSERTARQEQQVAEFRERERALTEALVTAQEMREEIRRQTTREAELAKQSAEQEAAQLRSSTAQEIAQLRAAAEREAAELRAGAAQEAARLRSEAAQEVSELRSRAQAEVKELRSNAQSEVTQLRASAQSEVLELRSTTRLEREREEEALRQARAQQQQFLTTYQTFLEQELAQLRIAVQELGVAGTPAGPEAQPAAPPGGRDQIIDSAGAGAAAAGSAAAAFAAAMEYEPPETEAIVLEVESIEEIGLAAAEELLSALADEAADAGMAEDPGVGTPAGEIPDDAAGDGVAGDAAAASPADDDDDDFTRGLFEPDILDEEASSLDPESLPAPTHRSGPMFPDDPIEDDELAFVDALARFETEPFEPEPFEPEPFEPEPFEPEPFEAEPFEAGPFGAGLFEDEPFDNEPFGSERSSPPAVEASGAADHGGFSPTGAFGMGEPEPEEPAPAADSAAAEEDLALYDGLAAEPDVDGVPGPVGLGSLLNEPQGWASAPSWTIEGVDLIPDSGSSGELPPLQPSTSLYANRPADPVPPEDVGAVRANDLEGVGVDDLDGLGADDLDEGDEADASEILRNAAAAGYHVPDLDEGDELLLEEVMEETDPGTDRDGDRGDGWLPTLLEDDK